jgi:hypothetical protein
MKTYTSTEIFDILYDDFDKYGFLEEEHKNVCWVKVDDELNNWELMRVYVAQQQIRHGDNLHLQEMYQYCNERIVELSQSKSTNLVDNSNSLVIEDCDKYFE